MSLLDENFDLTTEDVLRKNIISEIKTSRLYRMRKILNLPTWEDDQIEFERCNWEHVINHPYKYYIYLKPTLDALYVYLGKKSDRLDGRKCDSTSSYLIYDKDEKIRNLKQILEL